MKKILGLLLALCMMLSGVAFAETAEAPALQQNLVILFTSTVSHKMAASATAEAKRCNARIARCHSSSLCALHAILQEHCPC